MLCVYIEEWMLVSDKDYENWEPFYCYLILWVCLRWDRYLISGLVAREILPPYLAVYTVWFWERFLGHFLKCELLPHQIMTTLVAVFVGVVLGNLTISKKKGENPWERESSKTHKNYERIDVKLKVPKPTNYNAVLKPMNHNKFIHNKLKTLGI